MCVLFTEQHQACVRSFCVRIAPFVISWEVANRVKYDTLHPTVVKRIHFHNIKPIVIKHIQAKLERLSDKNVDLSNCYMVIPTSTNQHPAIENNRLMCDRSSIVA